GVFRSAMGRQNEQHLHEQDFARRPLIHQYFLGLDGLRAPGLQLSWTAPTAFVTRLLVEILSVAAPENLAALPLQSFGGGSRSDVTIALALENAFTLSETVSLATGIHCARGKSPGTRTAT